MPGAGGCEGGENVRVCKGGGWELEGEPGMSTNCGEPHLAQESYYKGRGQEVCTFPSVFILIQYSEGNHVRGVFSQRPNNALQTRVVLLACG